MLDMGKVEPDTVGPHFFKTMGINIHKSSLGPSTPESPIFGDGPAGKSSSPFRIRFDEAWSAGREWLKDVTGLDKREREK